MADFDEDTWRQPTEAEAKVIAARKEQSDKVVVYFIDMN